VEWSLDDNPKEATHLFGHAEDDDIFVSFLEAVERTAILPSVVRLKISVYTQLGVLQAVIHRILIVVDANGVRVDFFLEQSIRGEIWEVLEKVDDFVRFA
jgi:hypothetical protein